MPAGAFARTSPSAASSTPESRKSSKPIMEKRRRARINESLGQLKTLMMEALKKDSSRHSKLEKADILEMTVKHLRNLQRLQMTAAVTSDPSILGKYRAGFSECAVEVTRFLSTCDGVNAEARARLLGHLAACVTRVNDNNAAVRFAAPPPAAPRASCESPSAAPASPDAARLCGGYRLVPTADGQFAFLVPGAALLPPPAAPGGPHLSPAAPALTSDSVWRPW